MTVAKAARIAILVSAWLSGLLVYGAEEIQQCPDLSEHRKVLQQGESAAEKYYAENRAPSGSGSGGSVDGVRPGDLDNTYRYGLVLTPNNIDTVPLNNLNDIWNAQRAAHVLEDKKDYDSVLRIYNRILNAGRQLFGDNSSLIADTTEDMNSIEILRVTTEKEPFELQSPHYYFALRRWKQPEATDVVSGSFMTVALRAVLNSVVHPAESGTKHAGEVDTAYSSALKNYESALRIRENAVEQDPDLPYTVIMLSALNEWKKDDKRAAEFISRALDIEAKNPGMRDRYGRRGHVGDFPSASEALVGYCNRNKNWKLARERELDIVRSQDRKALIDLLVGYEVFQQKTDAIRLFETLLSGYSEKHEKNAKHPSEWRARVLPVNEFQLYLPPKVVIEIMDYLPPDMVAPLTEYLLMQSHAVENYKRRIKEDKLMRYCGINLTYLTDTDEELSLMADAMSRHGWNESAEVVYAAISAHPDYEEELPGLQAAIKFDVREKNYKDLARVVNQSLRLISKNAPKDKGECEQKIQWISPMIAALKSSSAAPVVKLTSQTAQLRDYYRSEGSKMECLQMAERIDNTASSLEYIGNYVMASKLFKESLAIRAKNLGASDPRTAAVYGDLARVAEEQGDLIRSDALYSRGIAIYRQHPDRGMHDYGVMLENYATLLGKRKLIAKANSISSEAKSIFRKLDLSLAAAKQSQARVKETAHQIEKDNLNYSQSE